MYKLLIYFFTPLMLLANPFETIETFQGDFTQSIINTSGKEIRYSGKMYAKKPYYIYWQYNNPIEKNVYINQTEVIVIEPELEQAIISKLDKEINILGLLQDAKEVSQNHYKSKLNNTEYSIYLRDDQLTKISYKDEIDNHVTIYFENTSQNTPLDQNIFDYRIPSDFDIIKK